MGACHGDTEVPSRGESLGEFRALLEEHPNQVAAAVVGVLIEVGAVANSAEKAEAVRDDPPVPLKALFS